MNESAWRGLKNWADNRGSRPRAPKAAERWADDRATEIPDEARDEVELAFSAGVMWALAIALDAMPEHGASLSRDARELDERITRAMCEAMEHHVPEPRRRRDG